jgi:hypothetical protein
MAPFARSADQRPVVTQCAGDNSETGRATENGVKHNLLTCGNALLWGWGHVREFRVPREFSEIEGFSAGTHGLNAVGLPEASGFTVTGVPLLRLGGALFELVVEQVLGYVRVPAGGGQRQVELL